MSDMQDFYRSEMEYLNYGKVTITLERENGKLKLHQVRGSPGMTVPTPTNREVRSVMRSLPRSRKRHRPQQGNHPDCLRTLQDGRQESHHLFAHYGMGANHNRGICFTADMEWLSVEGLSPTRPKPFSSEGTPRLRTVHSPWCKLSTLVVQSIIGRGLSLPHNGHEKRGSSRSHTYGAGNYTYRKNGEKAKALSDSCKRHPLLAHPLFGGTIGGLATPNEVDYPA